MDQPPFMNRGTVSESITVTDNRTGETREIPIDKGGVAAKEFSNAVPGVWFYDPGFLYTAAAESAITFVDGDLGILRYRGYPIEQLAEHSTYLEVAYLLNYGELPNEVQAEEWKQEVTHHTYIHENVRKRFLEGSTTTRTRWACSSRRSPRFRRTTRTRRSSTIPRSCTVKSFASSPRCPRSPRPSHRFSVGMPFVYPDNTLGYTENFLSDDVEGREPATSRIRPRPRPRRLFILHADHEQNCARPRCACRLVAR